MSWNDGYLTEIGYTYGYYREFNPANIRFCLLLAGFQPPEIHTACELGYGQGISLNIHAASETVSWYGTDFNPGQAAFAGEMARLSGAHCYADSFHEFLERADLPDFDYIALHGIWSWVSPENQDYIVDFVAKKLKIGGVLYISYNTFPGWTAFYPARALMTLYADEKFHGESIENKVKESFAFLNRLNEAKAAYFVDNPEAGKRVQTLANSRRNYVAHEYFNEYWIPCLFADMAKKLSEARLSFAASAVALQNLGFSLLPREQQQILSEISDPVLRQTTYDFMINTPFRKDIWIKGPRPLNQVKWQELLRQEQFILPGFAQNFPKTVQTPLGEVMFSDALFQIFQTTFSDGKLHGLNDLEQTARSLAQSPTPPKDIESINFEVILHNLAVLESGAVLYPCQSRQVRHDARSTSDNLNNFFLNRALESEEITFLASPMIGGGFPVSRIDQLFILAMKKGAKNPDEIAGLVGRWLEAAGTQVLKDGAPVEGENAHEVLKESLIRFSRAGMIILKNLLVIQGDSVLISGHG